MRYSRRQFFVWKCAFSRSSEEDKERYQQDAALERSRRLEGRRKVQQETKLTRGVDVRGVSSAGPQKLETIIRTLDIEGGVLRNIKAMRAFFATSKVRKCADH